MDRRCAVVLSIVTGCATTHHPRLTDDLARAGLADAVEDHAWHLEHGAKLADGVGLPVPRAEYAAALRRFAALVRSDISESELARVVVREFEIREVVLGQPFKVTAY